jgi:hypothetical protein
MTSEKAAEKFVKGLEIFVKVLVSSIFVALYSFCIFLVGALYMKVHIQGTNCTVLMFGMVWPWSEALSLHLSMAVYFLVGLIVFLFLSRKKSN